MRFRLRDWLIPGADTPKLFMEIAVQQSKFPQSIWLIKYGCRVGNRGRKCTPVKDMPGLVRKWVDTLATICSIHAPETHDQADFTHDDLLVPILMAPAKELRGFANALADGLEKDERIPYIVWRPYCELLRNSAAKFHVGQVIKLKEALAREVAQAVEKDLQPQVFDALVNALKWRNTKTLQEVKRAVEGGEKPRLTGRQSCLFLQAGDVMVML